MQACALPLNSTMRNIQKKIFNRYKVKAETRSHPFQHIHIFDVVVFPFLPLLLAFRSNVPNFLLPSPGLHLPSFRMTYNL